MTFEGLPFHDQGFNEFFIHEKEMAIGLLFDSTVTKTMIKTFVGSLKGVLYGSLRFS